MVQSFSRASLPRPSSNFRFFAKFSPWNRGIEKRRTGDPSPEGAEPHVSLVDWLKADDNELAKRYDRLFVPRNDARWLKRNALVAAGNVGGGEERAAVEQYLDSDDEMLREHATWALAQMEGRP